MHKYEAIICWSNEDSASVPEAHDPPGCAAQGATQAVALHHVDEAIDLWLATAREFGDPIPEPTGECLTLA